MNYMNLHVWCCVFNQWIQFVLCYVAFVQNFVHVITCTSPKQDCILTLCWLACKNIYLYIYLWKIWFFLCWRYVCIWLTVFRQSQLGHAINMEDFEGAARLKVAIAAAAINDDVGRVMYKLNVGIFACIFIFISSYFWKGYYFCGWKLALTFTMGGLLFREL